MGTKGYTEYLGEGSYINTPDKGDFLVPFTLI